MKILEATFIVSDGARGTFVVEFSFCPQMVRVWNRGDYGDGSAKPLCEQVNQSRRFKPCATHVAELLALALRDPPATPFAEKRAAAVLGEAEFKRRRGPKFKLIGGPT